MSQKLRKQMYDKLVQNGKDGKKPDLSQDDGALEREFGKPETMKQASVREAKAKSSAEKSIKDDKK